ncbi:MAG TPA: NAD(P)-dependent oxidoreductase [Solirubrobacteraceae bacterium]|nr:NAD(P)-dependent oxidoreductase [Solirubrobacteraceae bacterium]
MTNIAFLGAGTMGEPMARNLARAGFSVRAWNRTRERAEPLAQHGATICENPREAASGATVLVTMLSDASAVLDTAPSALDALERDAIWLQMSTIGIEGTEMCAALAERCGAHFVDAPVLGTRQPAEHGELVILASGEPECVAACEQIFEALGQRTLQLGEAGNGTKCKIVVNNWIVGLTSALAETVSLAEALEIDPHHFFDAIDGGALDVPYARMKGARMIDREFDDPDFRLTLARKDAELALAAAERVQLETPVLRAVTDRFHRAEREGHGDEDMAATYRATATPSRTGQ